jgi:hypothetical protein
MLKRFLLAFVLVVLCVLVWNFVTSFQPRQQAALAARATLHERSQRVLPPLAAWHCGF